jgi:hypothetical protein
MLGVFIFVLAVYNSGESMEDYKNEYLAVSDHEDEDLYHTNTRNSSSSCKRIE